MVLGARNPMKDEIVAKLSHEFGCEIHTERQVVYILVEARKLLERENTLRGYRTLKLCSDWAVHPQLCGPGAQEILKYFDDYEAEFQRSEKTLQEFKCEPLHGFLSLTKFRSELIESLSKYGVRVTPLASDAVWQEFIQHYCGVIQDCPLHARNADTGLVTDVCAVAWPVEQADTVFPGRRVVEWIWTLRTGTIRKKFVSALV